MEIPDAPRDRPTRAALYCLRLNSCPVNCRTDLTPPHIPQFPRAVSGNYACPAIPGYFGPGGSLPVTGVTQKDRYTSSAYCVQCPRIVAVSPPKPMDQ